MRSISSSGSHPSSRSSISRSSSLSVGETVAASLGSVGAEVGDIPGGFSFVAFASRTGPGFAEGWSASSAAIRPAAAGGAAFSERAPFALFLRLLLRPVRDWKGACVAVMVAPRVLRPRP
ncbi:hypothetical protein ACLKA6_018800 [Drosophila palustris]